jgi:succinyl-CoA synthetase beta subunit
MAHEICPYLELDEGDTKNHGMDQLINIYNMFIKLDAEQVEINPWAVTPDNELCCIDAKIAIDDSALFRQ